MYLHKESLTLRKLEKEDLALLLQLKNESWFGTHQTSILNLDDQLKWYDSIKQSNNAYIMIALYDSKKVGVFKITSIDWINRSCNVAWDVFKQSRGKGMGKKIVATGIDFCFEVLNLNRLDAEILENNRASQKCADYAGFVWEGSRRKAVHKCGNWITSFTYGIIRDDWIQLERVKNYNLLCNYSYMPKNDV